MKTGVTIRVNGREQNHEVEPRTLLKCKGQRPEGEGQPVLRSSTATEDGGEGKPNVIQSEAADDCRDCPTR